MYIIDTHTHIYLPEFDDDRPEMVRRALAAGVRQFLLPAIDSSTHERMLQTEADTAGARAMIGLHPCSVNQDFAKELQVVADYLVERPFVAVGETGLDFYWDKTFVEQQYVAFRKQAQMALDHGLPLVIHSREAVDECIAVVEEFPGLKGVFHCFSGNLLQAERVLATGFYLGIGGVVSFKNSGLDKVIEKTGLSKVVLETDAPYLAPAPYRGKRNEPAYLPLIVEKLAMISGIEPADVIKLTTENARNLFNLAD